MRRDTLLYSHHDKDMVYVEGANLIILNRPTGVAKISPQETKHDLTQTAVIFPAHIYANLYVMILLDCKLVNSFIRVFTFISIIK